MGSGEGCWLLFLVEIKLIKNKDRLKKEVIQGPLFSPAPPDPAPTATTTAPLRTPSKEL